MIFAVRATQRPSDNAIAKLRMGLENRWFGQVGVYGCNEANRRCIELVLNIDWERHTLAIRTFGETLSLDSGVTDTDVAIEVNRLVDEFTCHAEGLGLKVFSYASYAPGIDVPAARAALGYQSMALPDWAGERTSKKLRVDSLKELEVELALAASDRDE